MAFLIGGANSAAADAAYSVANSCRFNSGDSAYMHKTPDSTGVEEKFTFSFWMKFNYLASSNICVLYVEGDNSADYIEIALKPELDIQYNNGTYSRYVTKRLFRDPSAWCHIVIAVDTTQSTASNRHKLYVNGTLETSFSTETQIPQDDVLWANRATGKMWLGCQFNGPTNFFDGYLAEVVWIDGTQYAASDFGEFDSDSPTIWKPKDPSDLTFGTNGFYLDFEDSANLGNDVNGGTDLTEVNLAASDQMTDSPTNNYPTWNPLSIATSGTPAFSQGNLQVITPVSGLGWSISTMGATSGKWYAEVYVVAYASLDRTAIGITGDVFGSLVGNSNIGTLTSSLDVGYWQNGYSAVGNSTDTDYGDEFAVGDLMGIALNIDDNEVIFYRNNTAQNSGTAISFTAGSTYHFCLNDGSNGGGNTTVTNFGQDGTFAGNKTAQGNADGAGYGDFYYSPPSGFYALNTKNLATYG